jgi:SAM-dependent methyltransferase
MPTFDRIFCPICESAKADNFEKITHSYPEAVVCKTCGLGIECVVKLTPEQYAREKYDEVRNAGAGGDRWGRFHHDSAVAADRYNQLRPHLTEYHKNAGERGYWVDVGCGSGATPAYLRRIGWSVAGIEAHEETAREVSKMIGIPMIPYEVWVSMTRVPNQPPSVDVVSFFDSAEHMLDPVDAIKCAGRSVVPGGLIIIELPDLDSCPLDKYDTWRHRKISATFTEHIWQFSEKSLTKLFEYHLPGWVKIAVNRPVPERLQMAFKNGNASADEVTS